MIPKRWDELQTDVAAVAFTTGASIQGLRTVQKLCRGATWSPARYEINGADYRITIINRKGTVTRVYSPWGTYKEKRHYAKK